MNKIFICIPTYNERDNISSLIENIQQLAIDNLSIVIIDDNSPDKTGEVAEELKNTYSNIHVLHREKKNGLGPAYVAGFTYALNHGADIILEMDADHSHDPAEIPHFLKEIQHADVVLGSRYTDGGSIKNWSVLRRLISRFGNLYARLVLSSKITDLTGGYKCYRRAVLEKINLNSLSSLGYVFQIETTYKANKAGFTIKEIPITFTERREGNSKFNLSIFLGAFIKVLQLRFNSAK